MNPMVFTAVFPKQPMFSATGLDLIKSHSYPSSSSIFDPPELADDNDSREAHPSTTFHGTDTQLKWDLKSVLCESEKNFICETSFSFSFCSFFLFRMDVDVSFLSHRFLKTASGCHRDNLRWYSQPRHDWRMDFPAIKISRSWGQDVDENADPLLPLADLPEDHRRWNGNILWFHGFSFW